METELFLLHFLSQSKLKGSQRTEQRTLRWVQIISSFAALRVDASLLLLLIIGAVQFCLWAGYVDRPEQTDDFSWSFVKGYVITLGFLMLLLSTLECLSDAVYGYRRGS